MRVRGVDYYGPEFYRIALLFCCLICDNSNVTPHHVRSVRAGGLDYRNLVPLCMEHHTECEKKGRKTFEKKYKVDLKELAIDYATRGGGLPRP